MRFFIAKNIILLVNTVGCAFVPFGTPFVLSILTVIMEMCYIILNA